MRPLLPAVALLCLAAVACCGGPAPPDPALALLGGDTTVFDDSSEAFNLPARNATPDQRALFQIGDGVFSRNWVPAPTMSQGLDGLGPTFIAASCSGCHDGDGRGPPPAEGSGDGQLALFLRLSRPGTGAHGAPLPDPIYGDQLQNRAIPGVPPEGDVTVTYTEVPGAFADGEAYSLRRPSYALRDLGFGAPDPTLMVSPRIARQVIGIGLLEAISEETILGFAKESGGRPNYVWDLRGGRTALGRFGWKASQPTGEQQTMLAFQQDLGVTSALFPDKNCPPAQVACAAAPRSQSQPNLDELRAGAMTAHTLLAAVPARRDLDDPLAQAGEKIFLGAPCPTCHRPQVTTGDLPGYPNLSRQVIRPYTDLLLHDMGEGLADGRPDYLAGGREWRTAPLWGVGLIQSINDHTLLLHDGRARGFAEAILWHDGQASGARETFRALSRSDREALLAFLRTL